MCNWLPGKDVLLIHHDHNNLTAKDKGCTERPKYPKITAEAFEVEKKEILKPQMCPCVIKNPIPGIHVG